MKLADPITDDTHPLLREGGFAIESPPLKEFQKEFAAGLKAGRPSLLTYGKPRIGKTMACRYLKRVLQESGTVVAYIQVERQQKANQVDKQEFWGWFLSNLHRRVGYSAGNSRDVLLNSLLVAADRCSNRRIVLILDEAQYLTIQHLAMLKQLVDSLINEGMSPFVLLSASPEILTRVDMLRQNDLHDLIGRFFTRTHKFRGLAPPEMAPVLSAIDHMRYPADSLVTFTAYFAPQLWAQGWRLASMAPDFERGFREAYKKFRLGGLVELEMNYFISAVRWMLTSLRSTPTACPGELVMESVLQSGIVAAHRAGDGGDVFE